MPQRRYVKPDEYRYRDVSLPQSNSLPGATAQVIGGGQDRKTRRKMFDLEQKGKTKDQERELERSRSLIEQGFTPDGKPITQMDPKTAMEVDRLISDEIAMNNLTGVEAQNYYRQRVSGIQNMMGQFSSVGSGGKGGEGKGDIPVWERGGGEKSPPPEKGEGSMGASLVKSALEGHGQAVELFKEGLMENGVAETPEEAEQVFGMFQEAFAALAKQNGLDVNSLSSAQADELAAATVESMQQQGEQREERPGLMERSHILGKLFHTDEHKQQTRQGARDDARAAFGSLADKYKSLGPVQRIRSNVPSLMDLEP